MRYAGTAGVMMFAVSMAAGATAQEARRRRFPTPPPARNRSPAIATCYSAKLDTGAYVTAAMPKTWNGNLIVFAHGGPSLLPPTPNGSKSDLNKYAYAVQRGFGWVASSYRRAGYGVAMAAADSEDARKLFIARFGKPQRTILHGASYGGLVGAKLIETSAKNPDGSANYDGAFLNSGAVTGATLNYEHRSDLRAVYQYYCKNLPRPDEAQYPLWNGVAPDSKMTLKDLDTVVDECTGVGHPAAARTAQQKQNLANIIGVMGYPEALLVRHMQAATLLFRDIVKNTTGGRNPFSNINVRYKGSSDDAALEPRGGALCRRSGRRGGREGRRRPHRRAAGARRFDPFDQRPAGRGGGAVGLSRHRQGGRQRRPPGAGLHRRARPHRAEPAGTRRRARRPDAMDREGHQADGAIDRRGLRSAARQP